MFKNIKKLKYKYKNSKVKVNSINYMF